MEAPGPRKSVGAQITYGVRLDSEADAQQFLERLAGAPPQLGWQGTWGRRTGQQKYITGCVD